MAKPNPNKLAEIIFDTPEAAAVWVPLGDLTPWQDNPRHNDHAVEDVARSIERFGFGAPIIAREADGEVIAGHTRLKAAQSLGLDKVPVRYLNLNPADARLLALADNRLGELAEWDDDKLAAILADLKAEEADLDLLGWDDDDLDQIIDGATDDPYADGQPGSMQARFGVPPFSILDTRQGYWVDRRRGWLALGLDSGQGRGDSLLDGAESPLWQGNETSIFDPVLCEMVVQWFSNKGHTVLDPFAGGSVRGLVAAHLGREYTGVDLRPEQVEENRRQARAFALRNGTGTNHTAPATETTITCPDALTPVQTVDLPGGGSVAVKREDLFEYVGVRGSKARAGRAIAMSATGLTAASSRTSTMLGRVARLAKGAGIPARIHVAPSKQPSHDEVEAAALGAEIVKGKAGYLNTLVAASLKDSVASGFTHIALGLESDEYTKVNRKQAANIPADTKRVVVCVGSGNGLATVLHGMSDAGLDHVPVLGVKVGLSKQEKLLDRRAPKNWKDRVTFVDVGIPYAEKAPNTRLGHIELDPYYEAKCLPYLQPGDLFYVLACRTPGKAATQAPSPDMKPWQKGIDIRDLKQVSSLFKDFDVGMVHGAFGGVNERDIADAWTAGELYVLRDKGVPVGALMAKRLKSGSTVSDFTGAARAKTKKGDVSVRRIAAAPGFDGLVAAALRALVDKRRAVVEVWNEHGRGIGIVRTAFPEAVRVALKVRASSEQIAVFGVNGIKGGRVTDADLKTLCPLKVGTLDVQPLIDEINAAGLDWAEHYSSYNKRHSWWAVALRGYGGRVEFIEKPDEMSKAWKKANPDKLKWEIQDTPLRARVPAVEKLLDAIPGKKHRVRFMRLDGKGGELGRHADITDKLAGTADGHLLRIHVPIITSQSVRFAMWQTEGARIEAHMGVGEAWYLDTRKPHKAANKGAANRVHLVMDVEACPELRAALGADAKKTKIVKHDAIDVPEINDIKPEPLPTYAAGLQAAPAVGGDWRLPQWVTGDSKEIQTLAKGTAADLVFSCPPYADLEVYSDDPRDISNMDYGGFLAAYREIIANTCGLLKDDRFACFVVGEVRGKGGAYRNFVGDTVQAFIDAGLHYYNEMILVNSAGSLPLRAGRIFDAGRKVGKMHQNVLVFYKGDITAIGKNFDAVDITVGADADLDTT